MLTDPKARPNNNEATGSPLNVTEPSERVTKVIQTTQYPCRVTLTRGQKGNYGWEIDIQAEDYHEVLFLVDTVERELRTKYGEQVNPTPRGTLPSIKRSNVEDVPLP